MQPNDAFNAQKEFTSSLEIDEENQNTEEEFILAFEVNSSKIGMSFELVHEVVDFYSPTHYPFAIDGHFGVINLRGNVVPIINPFHQDLQSIDNNSSKYVILETQKGNLVGIVVSNTKKVQIDPDKIVNIIEEDVISLNGYPLRYVKIEAILKNYKERVDEVA